MEDITKKYIGLKFNKLTILSFNKKNANGIYWYNCKCDCGKRTIVRYSFLKNEKVKSCGCIRKERKRKENNYVFKNNDVEIVFKNNVVKIDKEDYEKIKHYCWGMSGGYCVTKVNYKTIPLQNILLENPKKGFVIDHIDRNKLNNKKENLRIVDISTNNFNRKMRENHGIYFSKEKQKWVANITKKGHKYFKYFKNKEDAQKYRKYLEIEHYGFNI